jgi:hypothetical protein
MLDGDEVRQRDGDRLLVRPYIGQAAGGPAKQNDTPGSTPEVPADRPAEQPADATVVLPVVPEQPEQPASLADGPERRMVLILVGAGLAIIVGAAIGVAMLWPGGEDDRGAALPAPLATPAWPVGSGAAPSPKPSPSVSASPSPSISPSISPTPSKPASPTPSAPSTPARTPSAPATPGLPPTADRVGPITGAGGHCLDVRGGVTLLGSPASVYDCNGTLSQRWTVAADGTLRVAGSCAVAEGGAVQIAACGTTDPGQWRAGTGASLVNVGTGKCLTDPDNGAKTGNQLQLATCGASGQRWVLP